MSFAILGGWFVQAEKDDYECRRVVQAVHQDGNPEVAAASQVKQGVQQTHYGKEDHT